MKTKEEIQDSMNRHFQNAETETGLQRQLSIVAGTTLKWALSEEKYVMSSYVKK